ncbi:MAG: hypothetical protein HKP27_04025 [Myxococcales bacterium]|nr:hypothetical protein [Myxococcales bacterium]
MMLLLLSGVVLLSVVLIVLGLLAPVRALDESARGIDRDDNVLLASALAPAVRVLAMWNERDSLSAYREGIERKLLLAGRPGGKIRGSEFLAAAELAGLSGFLVIFLLLTLAGALGLPGFIFAFLIGGLCIWLPHLWLDGVVATRRTEIRRQFPFFLDLAVMTIGAGSTFTETVDTYTRDNPHQAISQELRVTLGELQMGKTLQEGLTSMIERIDVEDVRQTLNSIVQGQRLGTPLVETLREQADVMRFKRSQFAERTAEELKVRIQGPAMMMMISVFLLILGPAFIEMLRGGLF